jgi:hypothetical protein
MNPVFSEFLKAAPEDRRDVLLGAAQRIGTPVQNVEKDFWVCWTLDALFNGLPEGNPRLLLASQADSGQQTPIVVVAAGPPDCYLVINGHKRVAAQEQLGRVTVEATVWAMSEAEAVLLSRSLRCSPQESALERGWLLAETDRRIGYGFEELARRFDRSTRWVARRLTLVELLPEAIQQ